MQTRFQFEFTYPRLVIEIDLHPFELLKNIFLILKYIVCSLFNPYFHVDWFVHYIKRDRPKPK